MSKPLCTEQIGTKSTRNDPLEVEDVTNASGKAESTPSYNLRLRFRRNVYVSNISIVLFAIFLRAVCILWTVFIFVNHMCYFTGRNLTGLGR